MPYSRSRPNWLGPRHRAGDDAAAGRDRVTIQTMLRSIRSPRSLDLDRGRAGHRKSRLILAVKEMTAEHRTRCSNADALRMHRTPS
jgi:hypothetical protein